jgi:GNAT superfamily N-acetyltransferase
MADDEIPVHLIEVHSFDSAIEHLVSDGLDDYNSRFVPPPDRQRLVVAAREPAGRVVGGLVGDTLWGQAGCGWLHVTQLWVAERARRRGIGRMLLRSAEREAIRRGCRSAYLDTFDFQAPSFYERDGYTIFGVQDDFPTGHRRLFLRKALTDRAGRFALRAR